MSRPDIHLYTAATMNGYKPVIFLEEAGVEYDLTAVDFSRVQQKEPDYFKLNPNGRIPTIIDRGNDDFAVFESGAILWYLAEKYGCFLPTAPNEKSETLQWLMFQMSGVGPMMGQAMYFQRIAAPNGHNEPFSIDRYKSETRRLLEVVNTRFETHDWLAAGQYTIADMATYPWARAYSFANVSIEGLDHLQAWFDRIDMRPAAQRALRTPEARPIFWGSESDDKFLAKNAANFAPQPTSRS